MSAVHVHHGLRGAAADADARHCAESMGAEVVRVEPGPGTEAEPRELRYEATAGSRAARHRSHRVGSGRDRALPARVERLHAGDQAAARGRRRPAAARRVARGDRGVLPRARSRGSRATRPTPARLAGGSAPRSCRRCAGSIHVPTRTCSRSRRSARDCRDGVEASLVELLLVARGDEVGDLGRGRAGGARVRVSAARRHGGLGALASCRRASRDSRCARAARAIGSQEGARRCRICSWTRRCRAPSGTSGRWSSPTTRWLRCPGSPRRRAGRESSAASAGDA